MSVSSVSGSSAAQQIYQAQQSAAQQKPAQAPQAQDTVQLSKAAQKALGAGDADHDGDSH